MSIFNTLIRVAAWITPWAQRRYRAFNANRTEAEYHLRTGNFSEAEKSLLVVYAEAERRRSLRSRKIEVLLQLAEARRRQNKLAEAEATASDAMMMGGGKPHARAMEELSKIYVDQGRFAEALDLAQRALQHAESGKPDPLLSAQLTYGLATIESRMNDAANARKHLHESIQLYELGYGADHPETANRLSEFAILLAKEGNHTDALTCIQRAYKIHQRTAGPHSPEAVMDLQCIAEALHDKGDLEQAAEQYEKVLRFKEKQVGVQPLEYAKLLLRAADLYLSTDNYPRAYELLHQAVSMLERYPEQLAEASERLAFVYDISGRTADAEKARKRAHDARIKALHPV
ncbi:MAG TPA: tetratricopeptide repeat protein [Bryobacteraceae bacterium]|nr:tetratricopeptide repeat protein [Bryobacteraceae bacterium]